MMVSFPHFTENISLAAFSAFFFCLLALRPMIQLGILDHPVKRSAHHIPTPKGGGIAILTGLFGALVFLHIQQPHHSDTLFPSEGNLAVSVLILAIISWWDDIRPFPARYKLGAQILASLLAALGLHPAPFLLPLMVGIGVFLCNALNFMDGLNGLASGVMMLSAIILALCNLQPSVFIILAASLLGFLPANFPYAKIFMGDVGSQSCALVLAWGGMIQLLSFTHHNALSPPLWLLPCLLAGIIWDVGFTLIRRILAQEKISQAHRGHLYQLAARSGVPAPTISIIHWFFVLWGGASTFSSTTTSALLMVLIPQLLWTVAVISRARTHLRERW